jgi:predicted nucleic acid-binding protein
LYLDSSSIVKLYLSENGSEFTRQALDKAPKSVTSLIAYAEVRAALSAARRARRIRSNRELAAAKSDLESDWEEFAHADVTETLVGTAGDLAEKHSLSGFDAIHLASALGFRASTAEEVQLLTWDRRLAAAAQTEGFVLAHEVTT